MGTLGVVLGVFLIFSTAVAWIGGDREKAFLEDTIQESRHTQEMMAAKVDRAQQESAKKDENMKALQGRLEEALKEKNDLERSLALQERNKRMAADEKKSKGGLWDSISDEIDIDGRNAVEGEQGAGDTRLHAAEASLKRESAERSEAEKKLAVESNAFAYIEAELTETLIGREPDWTGAAFPGGAVCPWDPAGEDQPERGARQARAR